MSVERPIFQRSIDFFKSDPAASKLVWWIATLALVFAALLLRLTGVRFGLPYHVHPNEPMYYSFTRALQTDGTFGDSRGDGYPPGFLALWIVEQKAVDLIAGSGATATADWTIERLVNVFLDAIGVLFGALAARRLAGPYAGLAAAAILAVHPDLLMEARVAGPDVPFTVFTLLSLWLLMAGKAPLRYGWLHASLVAALLAFLTKYQAAPIVGLPVLVMLISGRKEPRSLLPHLLIAGVIVGAVALWLLSVYGISQVHNIPYARTIPLSEKENPLALVSLVPNLRLLLSGIPPDSLLVTIAGGLLLGAVLPSKRPAIDWYGIGLVGLFVVAFALLMSLFPPVDVKYWRPSVAALGILWAVAATIVGARLAAVLQIGLTQLSLPPVLTRVVSVLPGGAFVILMLLPLAQDSLNHAIGLAGPQTPVLVGDWFIENVPQGARVAMERRTDYFNSYAGFPGPPIYKTEDVPTLFEYTIEEYQAQGIEFLIADDVSTTRGGYFSDPNRPGFANRLEVVADVPAEGWYGGTHHLILEVPPFQQHVKYLWLGESVIVGDHDLYPLSFRGYDLPRTELQPGFVLEFTLYWMSVRPVDRDYVVEARLAEADTGEVAARHASQPDRGNHPTSEWLGDMQFFPDQHLFVLPGDLPSGVYDLQISLADAENGERLPVTDLDGQALGDTFSLGEITITAPQ